MQQKQPKQKIANSKKPSCHHHWSNNQTHHHHRSNNQTHHHHWLNNQERERERKLKQPPQRSGSEQPSQRSRLEQPKLTMALKQKAPIIVSGSPLRLNPDYPSSTSHHLCYYRATVAPCVGFPKLLGASFLSLSCSSFCFCYRTPLCA